MRLPHLLAAAVLVLNVVACSSTATGTGTGADGGAATGPGTGTGGTGGTGTGFGSQPGQGGNGTCDGACAHYLTCKGLDDPANRAQCNQTCASLGLTPDQLANFQAADCASAIAAVDGTPASSSGSSGSASTVDCKGCTWDGSSCIYLTGSGGNYFACDRSCCP